METPKRVLAAVAVAALLAAAGCAGPLSNGTQTAVPAEGATPANADIAGDSGTIEFYISDEENAIDDFEHLNVTVTAVGMHRTGDVEGTASATAANGTSTDATPTNVTPASGTATATPSPAAEAEEAEEGEREEDDAEGEGDAEWVEYEVNRTVDLTELKGANATKLDVLAAPDGTYDKVFVYVDGIDATLTNGESVNVKLPSNKLQIQKGFTVGNGQNVSFVFDMSVHKAGNSGKYILKPVISESGTSEEVDIEDVDEEDEEDDEEPEEENETEDDETEDDEAAVADLSAEFQGPVTAGEEAKLKVTGDAGPVAGATVTVDGESVGETDSSGTITLQVPEDAEELEVTVEKGDAEVELERDLSGGNPSVPGVA
jgi:hypothetical protein